MTRIEAAHHEHEVVSQRTAHRLDADRTLSVPSNHFLRIPPVLPEGVNPDRETRRPGNRRPSALGTHPLI